MITTHKVKSFFNNTAVETTNLKYNKMRHYCYKKKKSVSLTISYKIGFPKVEKKNSIFNITFIIIISCYIVFIRIDILKHKQYVVNTIHKEVLLLFK